MPVKPQLKCLNNFIQNFRNSREDNYAFELRKGLKNWNITWNNVTYLNKNTLPSMYRQNCNPILSVSSGSLLKRTALKLKYLYFSPLQSAKEPREKEKNPGVLKILKIANLYYLPSLSHFKDFWCLTSWIHYLVI